MHAVVLSTEAIIYIQKCINHKFNKLHTMYAKYVSALHLSSEASTYKIFRFEPAGA
jgi:hypothetical protein